MPNQYIVTPFAAFFLDDTGRLMTAPVNDDETIDWTPGHVAYVDLETARNEEELTFLQQLPFALLTLGTAVDNILDALAT